MTRSTIEEEFGEIDSKNGWHALFQEIKEKCEKEAKEKSYSLSASNKNLNRVFNRYRDVNPYDHSRIIIHRGNVDYINANLVKMDRADRKYILTQGPLRETVGHFWLMIWEQNSKAIVMLNKLLEKKQIKCHMYWPERIGSENSLHLNDVGLIVEYVNSEEYANYSKRVFRLIDTESNTSREVIQFHYTTWPDFGIPSSPVAFLQFLKKVRESGALDSDVGPAVIHCSAGIGRSGTFCLVDCCLVIVEKEGEGTITVQEVLYELRRYRMGLIQTSDQLYFSYRAILEGIKLLQDPNFKNYEEVPLITNDNDVVHDLPPPLPPRVQSLQISSVIDKPLPMIPNSESVYEDLVCSKEKNGEYDDNSPTIYTKNTQKQLSIEERGESNTNDDTKPSSDNLIDENGTKEIVDIHETLTERNGNNNKKYINEESTSIPKMDIPTNEERLEESQVKRRKRAEKLMALDNKVHDIKRKQKEIEEQVRMSKRRKTLIKYVLAGVVLGSICMYAYAKLS